MKNFHKNDEVKCADVKRVLIKRNYEKLTTNQINLLDNICIPVQIAGNMNRF